MEFDVHLKLLGKLLLEFLMASQIATPKMHKKFDFFFLNKRRMMNSQRA